MLFPSALTQAVPKIRSVGNCGVHFLVFVTKLHQGTADEWENGM